ncbi:MAG TPA: hypothetical protein VK183_05280 [Flavobacterium sp.]|nr:hypothetical protein [Flavobacterium sp.]
MASAFWTLEDGRGMAKRWALMSELLELITRELKEIEGAEAFYDYLELLIFREENGDIYNGYGGFYRKDECFTLDFDLRSFAPKNRDYFWRATQRALTRLKIENNPLRKGDELLLTQLLDMHKRIKKGEDPMILNFYDIVEPDPQEKLGPGWEV